MIIDDSLLTYGEKLVWRLKTLYSGCGYRSYRMSKFEEYDLYVNNKDFLVSDHVIAFTDTNGKLMALKPDVTLSIIKNSQDTPMDIQRVFYNENVYRVDRDANSFREILQTGLECFGPVGKREVLEVISLADQSLRTMEKDSALVISNMSILEKAIEGLGLPQEDRKTALLAAEGKKLHEISALCEACGVPEEKCERALDLIACRGLVRDALPRLPLLLDRAGCVREGEAFLEILAELARSDHEGRIHLDFSVVDDVNYYNGIVFKGYVQGMPAPVLSGGQYDRLMKRLHRRSGAIGFAVYTGYLERLPENGGTDADGFLNVALPKGRLGDKVYGMFARAGYECPAILEENRKLVFENPEKKVRYFWVKPSDVAIYVERGAADIGVAGKDILLESEPAVHELLDLKTGKCRMAVAGLKAFQDDPGKPLRVATKFARIAQRYYQSMGRDIDIISLNGSIEIAPILGLSDVIVDIVETGRTLRENNLEVKAEILPISARLIANRASYEFKSALIERLTKDLSSIVEEEK
ncbi:MAG: ATP phosphoribosyltransferase [Clostridia bacterium]|nr:ATP phosphoribosyltransferase [Clostridia bacterium]